MKNKIAIFGILGMFVLIVLVSGCTSSNNGTSSSSSGGSSVQTYQGSGISFNYPTNWNTYTPDKVAADEVVNLKTSAGDTSVLSVTKNATSLSTDEYRDVWVNVASTGGSELVSTKSITIDGNPAYQVTMKNSGSEQQVNGFVKNGVKYQLLFTTGGSVQSIQSDINTILNSFKVT